MPEQHINTFNKGMTSDWNILFQPDGTYRFAKNCQLISQDGNNFSIKDCLGNVLMFTINTPYDSVYTAVGTFCSPIGFISFPDQLVVFSTNNQTESGGYGEIGLINYKPYKEGIQPIVVTGNYHDGYVPLYHHASLNFTKFNQIEGFGFEETSALKRIYWTDNLNEPRTFNINDPIFTTYIASGSIVFGEKYMVLEGAIEHPVLSGVFYGPGLTAGNVFTASATTYTDVTTPTPIAKVIEYYPVELLNFNPNRTLGNIDFNSYGTGNVICGSKMYFYRLVSTGVATSWSYGSYPIPVLSTTNSVTPSPPNVYFDIAGAGTTNTPVNSGRSVFIDITNIDTNYGRIQVACAEYDQLTDIPRQISIVSDVAITASSMTIEHTGNTNLGTLPLSDITLFPASILTCKTMTTNKNYILIGNIKERDEFSWTKTGTITEILHKMPVHEHDDSAFQCTNVLNYDPVLITPTSNPDRILYACYYVVTSVAGGVVVYDGNNYGLNDIIIGTLTTSAITIPAGSQVRPCVSNVKYNATNVVGTPDRRDFIQLKTGFWNYKDPAMASHKRGYWRNEKYRIGILFYDLKGNPMYVRHIGDITITAVGEFGKIPLTDFSGPPAAGPTYDYWYLNTKGLQIDGLRITKEQAAVISGFSIVRVERDKRIITEGLVMQIGGGSVAKALAGPIVTSSIVSSTNNDYIQTFICPDNLVAQSMSNYAVGSNLDYVTFLSPTDFGGGKLLKNTSYSAPVNENEMEARYLTQTNGFVADRKRKIVNLQNIDEGNTIANFGTTNILYSNTTEFLGAGSELTENTCSGNTSTNGCEGAAGVRTLIETNTAYPGDVVGINYTNIVGGATGNNKYLAAITVDKDSQYGGDSDAALANNLYISTGHFQPITTQVISDTNNTNNVNTYTYLEFNKIQVWGGDCFTSLIDYGHTLYNVSVAPSNSWGIKFPCQCNSNYDLRRGRTISNNGMHGNNGVTFNGVTLDGPFGTSPRLESFEYNKGYSSDGNIFNYPALPINFISGSNTFKERIRFAGPKFPGETFNSFRTFLINDYKDVDIQHGEINNIRERDGRVLVWQNAALNSVPVLERQILTGLSGAPTTLGTGGVVDRFDPINSYYGNQHQWSVTQTEYGFAWFDMRRKAFVVLDMNAGVSEVSFIEGLKGFFDEAFVEVMSVNPVGITDIVLNSPTWNKSSDRPLVGTGITGVYDPKLKMTYMTFKYNEKTLISGSNYAYVAKDFTIGYYHATKMFIAFYDCLPAISWNHGQIVVASNDSKDSSKYYGSNMASTNFVVGDIIGDNSISYICIADVTVASYLSPPNPTYFTATSNTSQLWVHNQPINLTSSDYQYNKFFGVVVTNEIDFIVNPKTGESFNVTNMEQQGNNVFPTSVLIDADGISASDIEIRSTSNYYTYIWDKICSNLPQSTTGRIANKYLRIKLIKKNWTTNPTVLTGATKILQYVKSYFNQKR